jgi:hypothetical protein
MIDSNKIQEYISRNLSPAEIAEKRVFLVRHGECEEEAKKDHDNNKQKGTKSPLTSK